MVFTYAVVYSTPEALGYDEMEYQQAVLTYDWVISPEQFGAQHVAETDQKLNSDNRGSCDLCKRNSWEEQKFRVALLS